VVEVHRLPTRENLVDDRGVGLRATWHPNDGVVVLSIWHDERCAGSFRLSVGEAARLARLLVTSVGDWPSQRQVAPPVSKAVNGD
jgi:hypothetical protein